MARACAVMNDALYKRRDSDRSSMGHLSSTDRRDGLRKSGEPVAFTVCRLEAKSLISNLKSDMIRYDSDIISDL